MQMRFPVFDGIFPDVSQRRKDLALLEAKVKEGVPLLQVSFEHSNVIPRTQFFVVTLSNH